MDSNCLQKKKPWACPSIFLFFDANFQKVGARTTLTVTAIASPQDFPKSFMLIIALGVSSGNTIKKVLIFEDLIEGKNFNSIFRVNISDF